MPGTASARMTPLGAQFGVVVVDRMSDGEFAALARRGAVGLAGQGDGGDPYDVVVPHPPALSRPAAPYLAATTLLSEPKSLAT